jgi:hypothetical protein
MIDERDRFERAFERFPMPEPTWDRLVRRRDRKQRNKRVGTAILAFAVAAAAFGVSANAFFGHRVVPADLPDTPGDWSAVRLPPDQIVCCENGIHAVTAGGPGLVAVGSSNGRHHHGGYLLDGPATVWTSSEGSAWTRIVGGTLGDGNIVDVTTGGPGLVAVGSYERSPDFRHNNASGFTDSQTAVVWTSTDGTSWTRGPDDADVFGGATMNAVASGTPGLAAVGRSEFHNDAAWFSADGVQWVRSRIDGVGNMIDVTAFGDGFVAVGDTNITTVAPTGGAAIWMSRDGLNWTQNPDDSAVSGVIALTGITDGPNGLVAIGVRRISADGEQRGAVLTSQDGLHWTSVDQEQFAPSPPDTFRSWYVEPASVTSTAGGYVAVGEMGGCLLSDVFGKACVISEARVWTSQDGQSWTLVPSAPVFQPVHGLVSGPWRDIQVRRRSGNVSMVSVTAWGSRFVAVGLDDDSSGTTGPRPEIWISR